MLYPPPHPAFLELHYFTSISRAMKGSGDDCELDDDDDDEDYEELAELEEVQTKQVRIWLDGLSSDREDYVVIGLDGRKQRQYRDVG